MIRQYPDAWIQTFTGTAFFPLEPDVADIHLADIAHALSHQCRYAGHTRRFYSVAEHCIHLCQYAPSELKLWALLHDASEAYLVDIPRPIKGFLTNYAEIEDRLMQAIATRFNLGPCPPEIKELDTRILHDERMALKGNETMPWTISGEPLGIRDKILSFGEMTPTEIKRMFIQLFQRELLCPF